MSSNSLFCHVSEPRKWIPLVLETLQAKTNAGYRMDDGLHWVFGYGSLIWRPGFAFVSSQRALLRGAHRSLCIYSHTYRGTPERPGLVFGLARGGACGGMAFAVTGAQWPETLRYLRERELVSGVYREALRPVRLFSGEIVEAVAYLVDEGHAQYAGRLSIAEQVELVQRGVGDSGANIDYVMNTAAHLRQLGIRDRSLEHLARALQQKTGAAA